MSGEDSETSGHGKRVGVQQEPEGLPHPLQDLQIEFWLLPTTPPPSKPDLSTRIELATSHAWRLLGVVTQQPIKNQLALALRDLQEATAWLDHENAAGRPAILAIAQLAIALAERRVTMVNDAVNKFGPDVTLVG